MSRRIHLMPALFLALAVLILALLLLASVHLASADCIPGPVACWPDDPLPPRAYIAVVVGE